MAISNEQITNLVPKETVDNIMKTYESIFKQRMERMEQISDSIKDLHNFISSEDKDISQNVNFKIEEIKRSIRCCRDRNNWRCCNELFKSQTKNTNAGGL